MKTDKSQPTTQRDLNQLFRDLDMAELMEDKKAIKRLTAELKDIIDQAFHAKTA